MAIERPGAPEFVIPKQINQGLVDTLRRWTKSAEEGILTNAVLVGMGTGGVEHTFHIPTHEDMSTMIGETQIMILVMCTKVAETRAVEMKLRGAVGLDGRSKFQS